MTSTNIKPTNPTNTRKMPTFFQVVGLIILAAIIISDLFINKGSYIIVRIFFILLSIVVFVLTVHAFPSSCPDNMHMVDGDKKCCPKGSHFDGHKCIPHS